MFTRILKLVDAVLGDAKVAIEIKSSSEIHPHHLKGLRAFSEEHPETHMIVVSHESRIRVSGNIKIYPVLDFLKEPWAGDIIV